MCNVTTLYKPYEIHDIKVEQNGGEYYGHTYITCRTLSRISDNEIVADGMHVYFDEQITSIRTVDKIPDKVD